MSVQLPNAKPPFDWLQSPRKRITAMAPFWKNMAKSTKQLHTIERPCGPTHVWWMLILTSEICCSTKGRLPKQKTIFRRRPTSIQNLLNHITTSAKSLCAKGTPTTLSYNSKKRCVFILTFQKPRKTCALRNKVKRQMATNEARIFRSSYFCIVFIGG